MKCLYCVLWIDLRCCMLVVRSRNGLSFSLLLCLSIRSLLHTKYEYRMWDTFGPNLKLNMLKLKCCTFCNVSTWLAYMRIRYARSTQNGKYNKWYERFRCWNELVTYHYCASGFDNNVTYIFLKKKKHQVSMFDVYYLHVARNVKLSLITYEIICN